MIYGTGAIRQRASVRRTLSRTWAAPVEALGLALLGVLLATRVWSSTYSPVGAAACAPLLALTVWLHVTALHGFLWLLLPLGAAYGLALCGLALRLIAPRTAARLPEILTAVSRG